MHQKIFSLWRHDMETIWPFVRGIDQSQLQPWCWPKQIIEQIVKLPVIWDMIHMWRRWNALIMLAFLFVSKCFESWRWIVLSVPNCLWVLRTPWSHSQLCKGDINVFFPAGSVGRALGWTHSGQNIMVGILWTFSGAFSSTHLPLDKMDTISQIIFADAFSWMRNFVCWLKFHLSLLPRVQLKITQQWFR